MNSLSHEPLHRRAGPSKRPDPPPRRMVDLDEDSSDENMEAEEDDLGGFGPPEDERPNQEPTEVKEDEGQPDYDTDSDLSSIDEEFSIYLKPPEERSNIRQEIDDLKALIPDIENDYKIVDRLGTGTFSSVYKAVDLGHYGKWDNSSWQPNRYGKDDRVFVALKKIYATSSTERIRNELSIMEDCRGARHVSGLITSFRKQDQVIVVMPYQRNVDFRVRLLVLFWEQWSNTTWRIS